MNSRIDQSTARKQGFSLVEVLVVILVIGIVAGIGVPIISSITERSERATAERHAQMVASMATNALHAGNATLGTAGSKEAALLLLNDGVKGTGSFEAVEFRLDFTLAERTAVLPYLLYQDGLLMVDVTAP